MVKKLKSNKPKLKFKKRPKEIGGTEGPIQQDTETGKRRNLPRLLSLKPIFN